MKKIDQFTNCSSMSKTMRFGLIPIGATYENFLNKHLLDEDEERAEIYPDVKKLMDSYHKKFIDEVLSHLMIENTDEYYTLYNKSNKTPADVKAMEKLEEKMRKQISKAFKSDPRYKQLFKADMINILLPEHLTDEEDLKKVSKFSQFTTYFTGFYKNRENMYTDEDKSTAISYRCINDNLPKFIDNINSFIKVKNAIADDIEKLNSDFEGILSVMAEDVFSVDYFSFVLSQSGIKLYNEVIGGYSCSDGTKIKGINEYINLHNQKSDRSERLPLMKPLFKQILSDSESLSFIPEKFSSDNELLDAVNKYYLMCREDIDRLNTLFADFEKYDLNGIHISSGPAITDLSNAVFGSRSTISDGWKKEYEAAVPLKSAKQAEKYYEKQAAEYKAIKSFTVAELQRYGASQPENEKGCKNIARYYSETVKNITEQLTDSYKAAEKLLTEEYTDKKKLFKNEPAIELIKVFLDNVKGLERTLKPLCGTGKEGFKDNSFYADFLMFFEDISTVDKLYDKVRNYMTQKPYSIEKIKLNFENPQFMGGWDRNKEKDYRSVLLTSDNQYYLAVMDKSSSGVFENYPYDEGEEHYEKIEYKLLPGPNKMLPKVFFAASNIEYFAPSEKIMTIYKNETFKKGEQFNIDDCHTLIDFYKEAINKHKDWSKFEFDFRPTEEYQDIGAFYRDIKNQGYSVKTKPISKKYIDELINSGKIYLFRIYNKDFSPYSKGTPNLHTMYFRMLFDKRNLADVVYKLNGEAEMFYRKKSISEEEIIKHPANIAVENKNPLNPKKTSLFEYEIIKDRRFTADKFQLHVPITLNFKSEDRYTQMNYDIRKALVECEDNYIIGIDRGERNLLYICVIDGKGKIVEQISLNEIVSSYKNDKNKTVEKRTDYHSLLADKEKKRDEARKNWTAIENIKELKEGYLSQVIHKICELVIKYDAVIAVEDLNSGFKNSRAKVERQVYQKFEKMLIDKLSYLADKHISPEKKGGLLHAYQLASADNLSSRQNGIIFYVPAWLTSKIDPVTGFADLLHTKYTSADAAREFFGKFDSITYNADEDMFEFAFDYSKMGKNTPSYKTDWVVCTNGERIRSIKNSNNNYDTETVILTDEFKKHFEKSGIDISGDIKSQIVSKSGKEFFEELMKLFALTLQMRNSIPNNTEVDYLISPVRNSSGDFYDSRNYSGKDAPLPSDADANGAYNIARKAMWAVDVLKNTDVQELSKAKLAITNKEWLRYVQEQDK